MPLEEDIESSKASTASKKTKTNLSGKPRVKKIRLKRKKKSESSRSFLSQDGNNTTNIIFVLAAVAFVLYFYGFIHSITLLPDIQKSMDEDRLEFLVGKLMKSKANVVVDTEKIIDTHKDGLILNVDDDIEDAEIQKYNNDNSNNDLPNPQWPVSIRDEAGNFEEILHPGDKKTIMSVPKFWSPPLTGPDKTFGSLMSRELATKFGTYVNGHIDRDYQNKGNPDDRTIFVAIASFRDWQCRYTVESLFTRAKFPNRLRVAVVDQITDGDPQCGVPISSCDADPEQALCKYIDQVDVYEVEAELAVGPVFARHIGHRLYRGEYYAMQIDAHVTFVTDWDVDVIQQMEATGNEMAVLSTYLTDIEGSIDARTGASLRRTRPIMCNTDYEGGGQGKHLRHGSQPEAPAPIKNMPQLQPYWAAGWSFSRGHFVVNIPYDLYLPMVFMGEESSIGIRAFTYGYDHYAPQRSICFHTYANGKNAAARSKVHHFWDNSSRYRGLGIGAMNRLLGIIEMNPEIPRTEWEHTDEILYGPGIARKCSDFFETFGIDVVRKKVQHNLCQFVQSGRMHHLFMTQLRPDGMGIDYSKIDYKFVDPKSK